VGDPAAWDAYLTAEIRIELPGGPVRVYPAPPAQASGGYPDSAGRPIAVITAHNPGGSAATDEVNEKAQAALEAWLDARGIAWWPAAGADPEWTRVEAGVAIPGMSEADATALGAEFGQEAIFLLTPASRKVIACATGRRSVTGWTAAPEAETGVDPDGVEDEIAVGIERLASEHGPNPARWTDVLLAESRWDHETAVDDPADALEHGEVSGEFLLRLAGRYVVYETNGAEWDCDLLDAPDDAAAIAAFRAATGDHTGH